MQFGYDLTSGCSVSLNRSALINLCCAGSGACSGVVGASYESAYSDVTTGLPWFYAFTQGYEIISFFLVCMIVVVRS